MASTVDVLAIDDFVLSEWGMEPGFATSESSRYAREARREEGATGSRYAGSVDRPAIYHTAFRCPDRDTQDALLAALRGDPTTERRILARRDDLAGTEVVTYATAIETDEHTDLDFFIDLESSDSSWLAESATITRKTFTTSRDQAMFVTVPGNTPTAPIIRINPLVQRTTKTATVGWSKRRRYRLTNLSDQPLYRYPYLLDLGSTTALVSGGFAQADGDDVRIVIDGIEQSRTLRQWNGPDSGAWFNIPALEPGESMVVEVWFGNASAGSAPGLAWPDLPAFDLAESDNDLWSYDAGASVSSAGEGLWHLSKGSEGALASFDVPGSWQPLATLENANSSDARVQYRAMEYAIAGTTYYRANLAAVRGPSGSEHVIESNEHDGVGIYNPLGITSVTSGFYWENPGGHCRFVIAVRNSGAEGWNTKFIHDTETVGETIPSFTESFGEGPALWVCMAVWPDNLVQMPRYNQETDTGADPATDYGAIFGMTQLDLTIDGSKIAVEQLAEVETNWTPPEAGGTLSAWYDAPSIRGLAANATVSQWEDESGQDRHMEQATTAHKPRYRTNSHNGMAGVDFDGTQEWLDGALSASDNTETIVAVIKRDAASDDAILGSSNDGGREFGVNAANKLYLRKNGGTGSGVLATSTGSVPVGSACVVAVSYNASSITFSINGADEAPIARTTQWSANNTSALGASEGSSRWFGGVLYEVAVFGSGTASYREYAEGYMAWRWDLEAGLAVDHPFKSATPTALSSLTDADIYEIATEIRHGGGDSDQLVAPYHALRVGNAQQESGAGTPRVGIKLSEQLLIDGITRTHEVWTGDLTAYVESISTHTVRADVGVPGTTGINEFPTPEWLPLSPGRPPFPDGSFDNGVGGWEEDTSAPGLTVDRDWDETWGGQAPGSLFMQVTANTAAVGDSARTISPKRWSVANP